MITTNEDSKENLFSHLGGANASVSPERVSVATNSGAGRGGSPPLDRHDTDSKESLGRGDRLVERERRPARRVKRGDAILSSRERGRLQAQGELDGELEHEYQLLEEHLAAQAIADSQIVQLHVVPWLLTQAGAYYPSIIDGKEVYSFLDGPDNQHYTLTPVPAGFVYHMLPKHSFVCRMAIKDGKRVLIGDESKVGEGIGKDWASSGDLDKFVDQAVEAVIPHVIGAKFDGETHQLTNRALVVLSDLVKPWPGARDAIQKRLSSPSFMDRVVEYHSKRRRMAAKVVAARLNVIGGSVLASDADIAEAMRRIKGGSRFKWWDYLMGLGLSVVGLGAYANVQYRRAPVVNPISSLFVALSSGFLLYRIYGKMKYDESKVSSLVASFNSGASKARFASVLSLLPTCSGLLRQLPGLVSGEGGYKMKVKFAPSLEPCKELKPYSPYGSVITQAPMVVPACCHHDINNAAAIRFLFAREQRADYVRAVIAHAKEWLLPLFKKNASKWWYVSRNEWLAHLDGKRRSMLVNEPEAVNLWAQNPIDAFVKREAYLGKTLSTFKPRMIMGRKLGYQNVVGHFMYSVSKFVGRVLNIDTPTFYVSGNSPAEVGEFATRLYAAKKRVFESDVSNWDGSLHPAWREFETWFIENCVPAQCPRWEEIKSMWGNTVVQGPKGFQMKTNFCRHSGDMWTSFMNSIINIAIVKFVAPDAQVAVLGDDNFWGTDENVCVDEIVSLYKKIGMKVEVFERPSIEQLEFCSGRFYSTDSGYVWGVKPFRVLAKFGLNLNRRKNHRELLYGTALSMLPVANHVPLIGEILRGIVSSGVQQGIQPDFSDGWVEEWRVQGSTVFDPSPSSYAQFQSMYSLSQSEMLDLFNVAELVSRAGLDAFPLELSGIVWLKGFDVDCGVDSQRMVGNQPPAEEAPRAPEPIPWFPLVVAPVLEECLKKKWPWLAFVFGALERSWPNLALHCVAAAVGRVCLPVAIALHALFNYRVWRINVDYEKCKPTKYADTLRSLFTEGGLFRPMLDCSPSIKTKDNKLLVERGHGRGPARKNESFNKKNNKSQKKAGKSPNNKSKQRKPKGSLGRSLLTGGLGALGGLLGPAGARVGASLGDWGSTMLGMGDYTVDKNSLDHGQGVPSMHNGHKSMRISHRELLTDVTGSTEFSARKYVINPGASQTFPWLSGLTKQFQSYKVHGLAFEFVSTSADALNSVNTALGSVIMATQYNVSLPDFTSKAQMAQYEFSCTTRPSRSLVHLIECDPKLQVMDHLFTRDGELPAGADYQFYDWGNFYLATVGMQAAAVIGELWVTYDIEFYKPRIDGSGSLPGDFTRISNGPFSTASPLGDIQREAVGNLGISVVNSGAGFGRIFFPPSLAAGRYLIQVVWSYASLSTFTISSTSTNNLTSVPTWQLSTFTGGLAFSSTKGSYWQMVTINGYSSSGSWLDFTVTGSAGSPATVDVMVVALPRSDRAF